MGREVVASLLGDQGDRTSVKTAHGSHRRRHLMYEAEVTTNQFRLALIFHALERRRLAITRSHIAGNHPAELVPSWQPPNDR